jgi:hypothetical protein
LLGKYGNTDKHEAIMNMVNNIMLSSICIMFFVIYPFLGGVGYFCDMSGQNGRNYWKKMKMKCAGQQLQLPEKRENAE